MTMAKARSTKRGSLLVSFGFVTDVHYADLAPNGNRYYRDADDKMGDIVTDFNGQSLDFVVQNGDLIDDGVDKAAAITAIGVIDGVYDNLTADRYYVIGNHDLDVLTKSEFLAEISGFTDLYYSFVINGVTFIVLDACYNSDDDGDPYSEGDYSYVVAYVPPNERQWLENTLDNYPNNDIVVFCHQRLDVGGDYDVTNASAVRTLLEAHGRVRYVFSGHNHINSSSTINGIRYFTVEDNVQGAYPDTSYCVVHVYANGIHIDGVGRQYWYA